MIESQLFYSVVRALVLYQGEQNRFPAKALDIFQLCFTLLRLLCRKIGGGGGGLVRDWTIVLPKKAFRHHKMMTSFKGDSVTGQDIYIRQISHSF